MFRSTPNSSISTSLTSPELRNTGGLRNRPRRPGRNNVARFKRDRGRNKRNQSGIRKIRFEVLEFCPNGLQQNWRWGGKGSGGIWEMGEE